MMAHVRQKIYDTLAVTALAGCAAGLLCFPKQAVAAASEGLSLCLNVIVPSLFPFFVLSTLAVDLGLAGRLGRWMGPVMRRLFNVNGSCAAAFLLGFLGGYPVGAKTAIALYERGECSRAEAERLLSFCNNSGPAFILGVVGAGVFSDSRVGLLLYLAHTLASVLTGLCFRGWKRSEGAGRPRAPGKAEEAQPGFASAFTGSVKSAFSATFGICGFVIFFTVLLRLLFLAGVLPALSRLLGALLAPFDGDETTALQLLTGLLELTSGVWSLAGAAQTLGRGAAMAAFMLGWAGLSIHCQTLSFLSGSGLSAKTYLAGKLMQGLFSAALVALLFRLFPFEQAAAAYMARQVSETARLRFGAVLAFSLPLALAAGAAMLFWGKMAAGKPEKERKKGRKRKKNGV